MADTYGMQGGYAFNEDQRGGHTPDLPVRLREVAAVEDKLRPLLLQAAERIERIRKREAEVDLLLQAIRNDANWSPDTPALEWVAKRNLIEWADSILRQWRPELGPPPVPRPYRTGRCE